MLKESYLLKNYARSPVEFIRGEGAYLFDKDGKEYVDFLSGIAVCSFGHHHPDITARVEEQIHKLWHSSNLFESGGQELLAGKLGQASGLDFAFFCNSGTEANEAAIKFARKWGGGRFQIIVADGGFHGRTYGSLSATAQPKFWKGFEPLLAGFTSVPFGNAEAVEKAVTSETIAVMVEPIQGENGIIVPPENYLRRLREICDTHRLLLILDEVQTGIGRTGRMFAHQWADIRPDVMTLAKGIANGLPLGAVLGTQEVGDLIKPGDHGSTFGGNPVAVAAANAVLDLLDTSALHTIAEKGESLIRKLQHLPSEEICAVRGKGLMIGIQFAEGFSAKTFASELLKHGVIAGTSGESVLRVLPPFIITDREINHFMKFFEHVLQHLSSEKAVS